MIRLHPLPDEFHDCPECGVKLRVQGWYIPGMRTMADLICDQCGREYYGDLLAGHSLYLPMLMNKENGYVYDNDPESSWLARPLRNSYPKRTAQEIPLQIEEFRPLKKV